MATTVKNTPGSEDKNPLDNLLEYYEKNKKRINTVSTIVVGLIVAFFAYKKFYQEPRVEKAASAVSFAQDMFASDSLDLALNGDGQHAGFLKIQKKYSGTPTANLCNYYAGVIYLKKGEYNKAIKYLEDFDAHGTKVQYIAYGALGDAYMEAGKTDKGIDAYKKASSNKEDEILTPIYLNRMSVAYQVNNKPDKAKEALLRIRDEYPMSQEAQDIDRKLARLGVLD